MGYSKTPKNKQSTKIFAFLRDGFGFLFGFSIGFPISPWHIWKYDIMHGRSMEAYCLAHSLLFIVASEKNEAPNDELHYFRLLYNILRRHDATLVDLLESWIKPWRFSKQQITGKKISSHEKEIATFWWNLWFLSY